LNFGFEIVNQVVSQDVSNSQWKLSTALADSLFTVFLAIFTKKPYRTAAERL